LKEIHKITGGQGARVVFDPVGGPTLSKLIKAMSFQGLLYLYGALSDQPEAHPLSAVARARTVSASTGSSGAFDLRCTASETLTVSFALHSAARVNANC